MKKIFLMAVFCLSAVVSNAQEGLNAYALTKPGVVVDYAYKAITLGSKPKLVGYVRTTVSGLEKDGDKDVVVTKYEMLNRKKKPSKNAAFSGYADGINQKTTFENGGYTIVQDCFFGSAGEIEEGGFFLKIPAELKVGDKLESGKINQVTTHVRKVHNNISYDDFTVVGEEDIETPAGVYHCMRIDGKLNGSFQTVELKDTRYSLWLSQNIGIVKADTDYYGISITIDTIEGF